MIVIPCHRLVKSALVALFVFSVLGWQAQAGGLPVRQLSITGTSGKTNTFQVEVASDPRGREKGLMFRKSMPNDVGMLFAFPKPRRVTMWMRNTLLGLDMVFIDASHHVVHIKENAQPMDESIFDSGGDVTHVLEINAGLSAKLGIAPGNLVSGNALEIKSNQ